MTKISISLVAAALLVATAVEAQTVYKVEPPEGKVAPGVKILVDDGSCPAGQIKEVTGGSKTMHMARSSRCIPRKK